MSSQEIRKYIDLLEGKNPTVGVRIDDLLAKVKNRENLLKSLSAITILFGTVAFASWIILAVLSVIFSVLLGIVQFTVTIIVGATILVAVSVCISASLSKTLMFLADKADRINEAVAPSNSAEQEIKRAHDMLINRKKLTFADLVIELYERVKNKKITTNDWYQIREILLADFKKRFMSELDIVLQKIKSGEITQKDLIEIYEFVKGFPVVKDLVNRVKLKMKNIKEDRTNTGYEL